METLVNLKQQLPIPIKDERQNSQSVPLPGPKKSYFSPRAIATSAFEGTMDHGGFLRWGTPKSSKSLD